MTCSNNDYIIDEMTSFATLRPRHASGLQLWLFVNFSHKITFIHHQSSNASYKSPDRSRGQLVLGKRMSVQIHTIVSCSPNAKHNSRLRRAPPGLEGPPKSSSTLPYLDIQRPASAFSGVPMCHQELDRSTTTRPCHQPCTSSTTPTAQS